MGAATRFATVLLLAAALVSAPAGASIGTVAAADTPDEPERSSSDPVTDGEYAPDGTGAAADRTVPEDETSDETRGSEIIANATDVAAPPDPERDVVGWEAGYWYNESVDVNQSDGLTDEELDRWTDLARAHIEFLTGREFTDDVEAQLFTPQEVANRTQGWEEFIAFLQDERYRAWNEQVEEARFVQGEDEPAYDAANLTAAELLTDVYGYYDSESNGLVVLRNETHPVAADNATLYHELVHALQDQVYNLSDPKYAGATIDEYTAVLGITEGQAAYLEHRYLEACRSNPAFDCVGTPPEIYAPPARAYGGAPPNATGVQPYTDGAAWVRELHEEGGYSVEEVFTNPPNTTEQTIHTERYPTETPIPLEFEDTARAGWETFSVDNEAPAETDVEPLPLGEDGAERVGELEIFGTFANQELVHDLPAVDLETYGEPDDGAYDFYNYTSAPSEGWGNDRLVPYRQETENGTEYGYVWVTKWDTERDAAEFDRAYRQVLDAHDAREVGNGTYVVPEGPYADAFHVVIEGDTVTIVNAPNVEELSEIRPGIDVPANATSGES